MKVCIKSFAIFGLFIFSISGWSQEAPQQKQQQSQAPQASNFGNYPGAKLTNFDPQSLQGTWVSHCLRPEKMPRQWMAPEAAQSIYRRVSYNFDGNKVVYQIHEYRDYACTLPLATAHVETGDWLVLGPAPVMPQGALIAMTFRSCGGVGCHPYLPNRQSYGEAQYLVLPQANRLLFGVLDEGGAKTTWFVDDPLYEAGTEPTAFPDYQYPN